VKLTTFDIPSGYPFQDCNRKFVTLFQVGFFHKALKFSVSLVSEVPAEGAGAATGVEAHEAGMEKGA
jgi:hypothetical protein